MSVSLNKANKIRAALKDICGKNKVSQLGAIVTVDYQQTNPVTLTQFKSQVDQQIQESRLTIERHLRLERDYRKLRDLIFSANVRSGVSEILSKIENFENTKKVYVYLRNALDGRGYGNTNLTVDIDASYAALSREKDSYSYNNNVKCAVYQKEELENKIKEITKSINVLEDERDKRNSLTKVELALDPATLEELGF